MTYWDNGAQHYDGPECADCRCVIPSAEDGNSNSHGEAVCADCDARNLAARAQEQFQEAAE